ncbi:hypothetical protein AB835_02720 [Candidatus Endobugula sertula]|uniref:PD-(D/E)XK endonuclease-like domain-containing protein n=1 Tax=Candidatus Endobugula sertula TaxID=62101 RepID=A0A1D2QSW1_9GAMM|nr:hypothetical protein AB835_02720 [Candidatus Endobugula sertula]
MKALPPLFNIQRILPYCEANKLILTPNNRLRSKILQAWGQKTQAEGLSSWQAPRIEVIDVWFSQQWEQLQAIAYPESAQVIANTEQQRVIWESITADCGFMQTDAIAKQAANALKTLVLWNQPVDKNIDPRINPQLIEWIQAFRKKLKALGYITPEDSYRIIGEAFAKAYLNHEPEIYLLGFDDIAPLLYQQLEQATEQLITMPAADYTPRSLQRLELTNTEQEMTTVAQWARSVLEQQAASRIGIIVPNLGQCRQQIEQAFTAEFESHSFAPETEAYTLPFNVSAGTPLGNTPLIAATLRLLRLQQNQWDIEFVAQCLLSPFWGNYHKELALRCALVTKLQSLNIFILSTAQLRYWAQRIDETFSNENPANVFQYFSQFDAVRSSTPSLKKGKQPPSVWVEVFLKQLNALQWPGERTLNSQEYQQTQLWYQLLETFTSLDHVLGPINPITALQQLENIANHTPFQAKVVDSPIQILGILEGVGLHFTHCWIMGLHQQVWPPIPTPNSLLPISLQREHHMPHASSLRELQYAQSLTHNYRHCADTVIFSSPTQRDDNEQHLSASQLISDIPLSTLKTTPAADSVTEWQHTLIKHSHLTLIDCRQGPVYTEKTLPGGAGLIKAQSDNAFDSFAKYRLGAQTSTEAVNGFSDIEKGNLLHNSLAMIWRTLKTQNALLALTDEALKTLVNTYTRTVTHDIQRLKPQHLSDTLCQLEVERQSQLILSWLNYEKQRTPFTVVGLEETHTITLNQRELHIRIDRIDQLQDGRYLIIDYKTGDSNTNAWKGDRPKEPQLPLYALTYDKPVAGISFAQINVNDQIFKGLAETEMTAKIIAIEKNRAKLPTTWKETLAHWQTTIAYLLDSFQQGDCTIDYRDSTSMSYARELLTLNRFYEAENITRYLQDFKS